MASGRPSPSLLKLFGPSSMIAVAGLTDADPHTGFRDDMCGFADDRPSAPNKLRFMHQVLKRDATEVRMFLDHLERHVAAVSPAQRREPEVAAALSAIEHDRPTRERYLVFARDADDTAVQTRMMALARHLAWLSPAEEQAEFVRMLAGRMARGSLGKNEVDQVCQMPRATPRAWPSSCWPPARRAPATSRTRPFWPAWATPRRTSAACVH